MTLLEPQALRVQNEDATTPTTADAYRRTVTNHFHLLGLETLGAARVR